MHLRFLHRDKTVHYNMNIKHKHSFAKERPSGENIFFMVYYTCMYFIQIIK